MRGRVVATLSAVALLFAFPGISSGATYRVRATGSSAADFRWNPDFRHITKGNRVKWTNPTDATHRVVAYRGRWDKNSTIAPGETTAKRFRRAGVYKYRCTVAGHSTLSADERTCEGMCGTVHVTRD